MKAIARHWRAFRAWPEIVQLAAWLGLFALIGIFFVPKVFA